VNLSCSKCGATLKVNPNLLGATVTCPSCGASLPVAEAKAKPRAAPPRREDAPRVPSAPGSIWLFLARVFLLALGGSCVAGALFRAVWDPPAWSYFRESPPALLAAAALFALLAGLARLLPLLAALAAAILVSAATGLEWRRSGTVDASRVLALSVALSTVWLALEHRRAVRR